MPVYVYKCEKCGEVKEFVISVKDFTSTLPCDWCNGTTHVVPQPTGIAFKGKGWTPKFGKGR